MTSQGRRIHRACLFRLSENCPFRKLRRNMCNDSKSSLVPAGGQWESSQTQQVAGASVSYSNINRVVSIETFSRLLPSLHSASHVQQEFSAMDTYMDPSTTVQSYMVSGASGPANFSLINQQRRLSSCDTSMDLDTGVDPETGERAQASTTDRVKTSYMLEVTGTNFLNTCQHSQCSSA